MLKKIIITLSLMLLLSICLYTPIQQTQQAYSESETITVYITNTGAKYHNYGCQYLRKSMIAIELRDAISRGYDPCSVCQPYYSYSQEETSSVEEFDYKDVVDRVSKITKNTKEEPAEEPIESEPVAEEELKEEAEVDELFDSLKNEDEVSAQKSDDAVSGAITALIFIGLVIAAFVLYSGYKSKE